MKRQTFFIILLMSSALCACLDLAYIISYIVVFTNAVSGIPLPEIFQVFSILVMIYNLFVLFTAVFYIILRLGFKLIA